MLRVLVWFTIVSKLFGFCDDFCVYSKQKVKRTGKCSKRAIREVHVASILGMTEQTWPLMGNMTDIYETGT